MNFTRRLAEFVACTTREAIPGDARLRARRAVLDTLGVALAGSREEASRTVAEMVREAGGRGQAAVLGHALRAPAAEAAFVNGTSAHALDFDDVSASMRGHPSAPLLPALLALGERLGSAGRDVIDAYVLGFEVQCRLGRAIGEAHYRLGWHATSTFGTIGAAAGCARLLGLDLGRTANALGIAASLANGIQQNFGSMTKALHAGHAARNGVTAALLARRGFDSDAQALEGPNGFLRAASGGSEFNAESLAVMLGETWEILSPGIGVKRYPCCYATHRAVDAALEVREDPRFDPDRVKRVDVSVTPGTLIPLLPRLPETGLEAKFSLEYCVAAALLDGSVGPETFGQEAIGRSRARELISRLEVAEQGEPMDFPIKGIAEVRVHDAAGRGWSARVETPKGDPKRPLTADELVSKFRHCSAPVLGAERADQAAAVIERMDGLSDVRELMEALQA